MTTATKRPRITPETIEFRRAIFEIAAEIDAEGLLVEPAEVATRYREEAGDTSSRTRPARIAQILADPARYSPFVDEVAVDRALAFDAAVIENLSDLEWQTVVERLAAMADPWEMDSVRRSYRASTSGEGWSLGDLVEEIDVDVRTERRLAYEYLPEVLRDRLKDAVLVVKAEAVRAAVYGEDVR